MKQVKLVFHQRSQQKQYAGEDLALCSKEFPHLKENDVVEICIPASDGNSCSFFLKVTKGSLREDFSQKDTISIDQAIAATFQLKSFCDIFIQKIDPATVELDSVELTFKDQYLGRSEMWRLKASLDGSCIHVGKKVEFCSGTIRCQTHELWAGGLKVCSGLISEATKIVFRSLTSMVYLFIQMSSEMWEFDVSGELYFEKAVNGFLSELFSRWKQNGSNHEVTIVLFSRLYYYATSIDQFPDGMRGYLSTDYKGQFYEDFYRVVIQNEKYEDWRNTLISLRQVFVNYHDHLMNFHHPRYPDARIPKAYISSAAQGNFLEVLNMSLNVFEKHYVDRSFERTGQLSVVITPGVGVFEVDRDLTNVTMQRVIDNGVGSDLVCVGEQPLHAVPLLKFNNKSIQHDVDDYSMPHWINLSFYSTHQQVGYASFIPRIKLPTRELSYKETLSSCSSYWRSPFPYSISSMRFGDEAAWPNSIYDFEHYDDCIFKPSSQHSSRRHVKQFKQRSNNLSELDFTKMFLRQNSEPEIHAVASADLYSSNSSIVTGSSLLSSTQPSTAITIPSATSMKFRKPDNVYSTSFGALNIEWKPSRVALTPINDRSWLTDEIISNRAEQSSPSMSSHGGSPKEKDPKPRLSDTKRPSRSLINPFDPSQAVIKLTSNRRRWTHIFPRGPTGTLIQQHHFSSGLTKLDIVPEGEATVGNEPEKQLPSRRYTPITKESTKSSYGGKKVSRLWGATGEQEWSPTLTTGVDWKSLTIPACLPLTTDYFPDQRSFQNDYSENNYTLLPDAMNADSQRAYCRKPLTTQEVFLELVSQRLAQGFQNVIKPKKEKLLTRQPSTLMRLNNNNTGPQDSVQEYFLSIGRIFHKITLSSSTITVTRYSPRHPYRTNHKDYKFWFCAPHNTNFEVSYAHFSQEKLENYNWNYLDQYICTRGVSDFSLMETLKYWRLRIFILPINQITLKKLVGEVPSNYDAYEVLKVDEKKTIIQDFMKFIETCINRIRRPNNSVPKGPRGPSGSSISSTSSGTFRERVNSNQLGDRPRIRSGSKLMEKQRQESGSGRISPFDANDPKYTVGGILEADLLQNPLQAVSSSGEIHPLTLVKANASITEIVAAMRCQITGLSFIKSSDLPAWTFVSYDAVVWACNHVEGINSDILAIELLNRMLRERWILHASGHPSHQFLNGFHLYFIATTDGQSMEPLSPQGADSSAFSYEWMEVNVPFESDLNVDLDPNEDTPAFREVKSIFKDVYIDVDISKKSDRQEWGHVRYQSVFWPDEAFEITVQWIQATGAIIADLVQSWSRKAQQCNLQLVPVPTDPFALPNSDNSDPLRGPISIKISNHILIELLKSKDCAIRLMNLLHAIAIKFGFMLCSRHSYTPTTRAQAEVHYVHSSGNMFLIIPRCNNMMEAGFLWSWNYLVSKRWRTSSTPVLGDEGFMFKVLYDFKSFCLNDDNRLATFWNTIQNNKFVDA